jgi:hypothetical protein
VIPSPVRTSDSTDQIDKAMAEAQAELTNPIKTRIANVEGTSKKTGKEFKIGYAYADIADLLAEVRPVLGGKGIAVFQIPRMTDDLRFLLITTRLSFQGQWIEGDYPVCATGGEHQEMGKAMTYARRHALGAMIGVAPERDDDGVGAALTGLDHHGAPRQDRHPNAPREDRREPPRSPSPPPPPPRTIAVVAAEAAILMLQTTAACDEWGETNRDMIQALSPPEADAIRLFFRRHRKALSVAEELKAQAAGPVDEPPLADEPLFPDEDFPGDHTLEDR